MPEAAADDYLTRAMTALFHGPPTRGPVMNFCESETPRRQEKKNLGQLAAVSPRLTCTQQESLAPGEPHSEWIVQHPTSRASSRPIGVEHRRSVRPRRERPSTNQSSVPWERVHRGTWPGYAVHVRGLGEVEHCCCVKCKRRSASVALLTSF